MRKSRKAKQLSYINKQIGLGKLPLFLFLFALFYLQACIEAEEGCLDSAALNFNVSADEACGTCCTYPSFSLSLRHKGIQASDTVNLNYNTNYLDDFGNTFAFQSISYYLSNVHLINEGGDIVALNERLDLPTAIEGSDTTFIDIEDNFALLDPSDFRDAFIGTIRESGLISQLEFTIGLDELIQSSQPDYLPEDHPLAAQDPSMYDDNSGRYLYNRIALYRDASLQDAVLEVIEITEEENKIPVTLNLGVEIPVGSNVEVTLEIDYLGWLAGVDVQNDSNDAIKAKIVSNLAQSFRVFAVSFSR